MIDLSLLPPPDVVESVDFEELYQEVLSIFREFMKDQWTAALESDPVVKLMEVMAYREMLTRARVNSAAKASLLAFARRNDLDNRAADYGVERLTLRAEDLDAVPPVEAVMEDDDALLYRTRLSLEALSVAGSSGAYEYHGLSSSAEVAQVSVDSPRFSGVEVAPALRAQLPPGAIVLVCDYDAGLANPLPGDVSLAVLPTLASTTPPEQLVAGVLRKLSSEDVRPITDRPRAQLGVPTDTSVEAVLWVEDGPDPDVVAKAARKSLDLAIAGARRLSGQLSLSSVYAALHVTGITRVDLLKPVEGLVCDKRHYPRATSIVLTTKVMA